MAITKQPYELSVWSEKLNDDGIKEEIFGAIIGGHDMTFLGRATQVKLKRELKGTNTLTFQMPSKYFDSQVGDYVHNELVDLIHNETKIKLKFGEDWYEFYVKKITENKKFKALMISYSCEDAFIDELSRTGYEIEFASDLNNSVAETGDFMEDILDMSIWDYTPEHNVGDFTEFNENRFYKIPLEQFGGSITGYKIKLEVKLSMMFDADGNPNDYLLRYLHILYGEENYEDTYEMMEYTYDDDIGSSTMTLDSMTDEQYSFIENLLTIYNIFTDDERMIEFGDDLARERELFWDPYYKDNGIGLLSDENKYTLTGDYIYVPITDLSMIMGSIYEDAYTAVEEPARYGSYYNEKDLGYALQPSSENPRAFVQFIFLDDGDVFNIDEEDVLCNNDFHYVIPIEEWNELLKAKLGSEECVIYWKQVVPTTSTSVTLTTKYSYDGPDDDGYMWTTDAMPSSSTIDDFTWYPVYYEGYLTQIGDTDVTQARKISVTDRTEYNAEADMFVTVYNNKSDEYVTDQVITEYIDGEEITHNLTLYTDNKLEKRVLMNYDGEPDEYGDTEFRVCSKLNTRQILPTLAANLVENGSSITDTNGWETRIQNKNSEKITGTSSYSTLLTLTAQSTVVQNATSLTNSTSVTIEDYDIEGTDEDLSVSDYYLELLSPCVNNILDFSKEGQTEIDYALNFGIVSQEKQIEKDKVYAIRMITGNMITTGAAFKYRGITDEEAELDEDLFSVTKIFTVDEASADVEEVSEYQYIYSDSSEEISLDEAIAQYEQLFQDYKALFDCFAEEDRESAGAALAELGIDLSTGEDDYNELNLFYTIIDRWPDNSDVVQSDKIGLLDALLTAILFGAEEGEIKLWNETNTTSDDEDSVSIDSDWTGVSLDGLISLYDEGKEYQWQKLSSLAIEESSETNSYSGELQTNYKSSDIQYLKFYLYWHIVESQQATVSTYAASYSTQLTKSTIETWISEYLLQDKEFEKKVNVDLDKVLIGEGAVDLSGNYQVQGTVFTGGSITTGNEYISFDTIFTSDEDENGSGHIDFIPDNGGNITSAGSTESILTGIQYHYYSTPENTPRKTWEWKLGSTEEIESTSETGAIIDYPLLLFKANQTLENPYVAVKVESAPLEICFDSIVENKYGYDDINGVQFNVTDGIYYYEGADIKLVQVNSTNVSDAFRTAIGFDDSTGDFDVETAIALLYRGESSSGSDSTTSSAGWNQIMTADDDEEEETDSGDMFSSDSDDYLLQSSRNAWTDTIDVENPAYCSSFLKNSNEDKSYPYLLFISNKFRGIVYLEANISSDSDSEDDEEESGGED